MLNYKLVQFVKKLMNQTHNNRSTYFVPLTKGITGHQQTCRLINVHIILCVMCFIIHSDGPCLCHYGLFLLLFFLLYYF